MEINDKGLAVIVLAGTLLLAPAARAGAEGGGMTTRDSMPRTHSIDTSRLNDADRCKWQRVVELANQKDATGGYVHPRLHDAFAKLDTDSRTFVVVNENLGRTTVGEFTITRFNGPNDFSEATLAFDFKKIKELTSTTRGDFDPTFRKFEGLFGADGFSLRLAEAFGHEANHAIFAIENPSEGTQIQSLMNKRDADFRALPVGKGRYPLRPQMLQEMEAADEALIPSERFAQEAEKDIHAELRVHPAGNPSGTALAFGAPISSRPDGATSPAPSDTVLSSH